jgi:hypothetical protein
MKCAGAFHLVLLVLVVSLLFPPPARANSIIKVGDGTAASCTEEAVRFALAVAEASGGGTIRFKCGKLPATIVFSGTGLVIPGDTVIDGGGLITFARPLSPNNDSLISVPSGNNAGLQNLTILGRPGPFNPLIVNSGTLAIKKSTLSANAGGAIWNHGALIVDRSTFSENGDFSSAAIRNGGQLSVKNSLFFNNEGSDAGAISNGGSATIKGSSFLQNDAAGYGAILNTGTLTVTSSEFVENFGVDGSGGIGNRGGTLTVERTTFSGNRAGSIGVGGIANIDGTLTVDKSVFSENTGLVGGGIISNGTLTVRHSEFFGNTSRGDGGGLYIISGTAAIYHGKITGNTAAGPAAASLSSAVR